MENSKCSSRHASEDELSDDDMLSSDESTDDNSVHETSGNESSPQNNSFETTDHRSLHQRRKHNNESHNSSLEQSVNKSGAFGSPKSPRKEIHVGIKECIDSKLLLNKSDDPELKKTSYTKITCLVIAVLVFLVIFLIPSWFFNQIDEPTDQKTGDRLMDFKMSFKMLKQSFNSQSKKFWGTLETATDSIVSNGSPTDPAVILLVVPQHDVRKTAECFINKYIETTTKFFNQSKENIIKFNFTKSAHRPSDLKLEIDNTLNASFSSGIHLAIFEHLEFLAGEAAMMFHGYCDNDNAPFKNVIMIMTIHLQDVMKILRNKKLNADKKSELDLDLESISNERDDQVEKLIKLLWEDDISEDNVASLLSRIGNSMVFMKKEQDKVLNAIVC